MENHIFELRDEFEGSLSQESEEVSFTQVQLKFLMGLMGLSHLKNEQRASLPLLFRSFLSINMYVYMYIYEPKL